MRISQDIRFAARVWRRRPVIALAAVLTIALGAGMNVAVFQAIWQVMLKPLPYADPDRLVQIWIDDGKTVRGTPSNVLIERWREEARSFSKLAAYRPWQVTVISGGEPEQVAAGLISPEFFETLGMPLLAGRAFAPAEVKPGADNVVMLREGYWRRRFAADGAILGGEISLDGGLFRVVGIVPDSFPGTVIGQSRLRDGGELRSAPDLYLPISRARVAGMRVPLHTSFLIGRLQDGAPIDEARQELTSIAGPEERRRIWLSPLQNEVAHRLRPALLALLAATGCILLIACANLANLLLAQAVSRRRELAVRAALGAGRSQVFGQLITEAVAVLLAGAIAGIAAGQAVSRTVTALYPGAIPRWEEGGSAWMAYVFALAATVLAGLLFGAVPAWRLTGETQEESLRVGSSWMSRGGRRWANSMVAVQVGLTTVVLIAAGLLVKSFLSLRDTDIGFGRENIITAIVDLPEARYKSREERARFGAEWVKRLNSIPGVSAAGVSNSIPLRYTTLLDVRIRVPDGTELTVGGRAVGGEYFEAMGMSRLSGEALDESRKDQVMVNEAFVRKYLEGRAAVGTILGAGKQPLTITGVVKDVRHLGLREPARPEMSMPYATFPLNPVDTVARSTLPPAQVAAAMRRQLGELDNQLALGRVLTMNEVIDGQLAQPRFHAVLLGLFAFVALALASVGTYGVLAHTVRSRVPEFGLRRALGARTPDLLRLVLWDGIKAPLAGLAAGLLLGGVVVGRTLGSLLYGIEPRDPGVLLLAAVVLGVTTVFACAVPGHFAARVEPSQALRQE